MKTLEMIIEEQKAKRYEGGSFGIAACKESINFTKDFCKKSYYQQLEEYVERANTDMFFNKMMVLACWELINNK